MNQSVGVSWHFWLIAIIGLLWNAMGILNFLWQLTMSPEALTALSEAQQALIADRPPWVTLGFAVAVFAGTFGCVMLLMKKKIALLYLTLSLLGVLISMIPVFGMMGSVQFTTFERLMYLVATPLLAAVLVWYTRRLIAQGKLN